MPNFDKLVQSIKDSLDYINKNYKPEEQEFLLRILGEIKDLLLKVHGHCF